MRSFERPMSTLALIAALAAALALGGCGRKSGLDLPPSASAAPASASAAPVGGVAPAAEAKATAPASAFPTMRAPRPAPRVVPKRDLPIDVLLN